MPRTERGVLNHLIDTCRDGERGFRYAANHVENPAIKALFLDIAAQRGRFADDLTPHARRGLVATMRTRGRPPPPCTAGG